jgi:hypothetical protein
MDGRYNPDPEGKAEQLDFEAINRKADSSATLYIKAPLDSGGVVVLRGKMELVESRANATELVYGDADFLEGVASNERPDLNWQKEVVSSGRYSVKGDPSKA